MSEEVKSIFYGPVLSRRFGHSLGIDLIPYKICSFDCIYCQLGRTTIKTVERKRYREVDVKRFLDELEGIIKKADKIDYITFAGLGEPTLNTDIGLLIRNVKKITDIPVAVLTNGSLLKNDDVVDDISYADLIKVSFDGCNEKIFKKINRPFHVINLKDVIDGVKLVLKNTNSKLWFEIMLVKGINDDIYSANKFKEILDEIFEYDKKQMIEKIHVNTPVRPSGVEKVLVPDELILKQFRNIIGSKAEIIKQNTEDEAGPGLIKERDNMLIQILGLARRRPVTTGELSAAFNINMNETVKYLRDLLNDGKIKYKTYRNNRYYYC